MSCFSHIASATLSTRSVSGIISLLLLCDCAEMCYHSLSERRVEVDRTVFLSAHALGAQVAPDREHPRSPTGTLAEQKLTFQWRQKSARLFHTISKVGLSLIS